MQDIADGRQGRLRTGLQANDLLAGPEYSQVDSGAGRLDFGNRLAV